MFFPVRIVVGSLAVLALLAGCAPASQADRGTAVDRSDAADAADAGMNRGGSDGGAGAGGASPGGIDIDRRGGTGGGAVLGVGGAPAGAGGAGPAGSGGFMPIGGTSGAGGAGPGSGGTDGTTDALPGPPDSPPDVSNGPQAFLVVADPSAMAAADTKLKMLLESKGYAVKFGDDDQMGSAANGSQLVVLSGSSASAKLAAKYRDIAIPTLVLVAPIFDDMKLTGAGNGDFGEDNATQMTILAATHPLAAKLTGTVSVITGGALKLSWGKPAATAGKIAALAGANNATKIGIFAYEKGALMVAPTLAPARRVGMFVTVASLAMLTPEGEKLLSAAIDWLMGM